MVKRFFIKSMASNGIHKKINIDKSASNTATIEELNKENKTRVNPF